MIGFASVYLWAKTHRPSLFVNFAPRRWQARINTSAKDLIVVYQSLSTALLYRQTLTWLAHLAFGPPHWLWFNLQALNALKSSCRPASASLVFLHTRTFNETSSRAMRTFLLDMDFSSVRGQIAIGHVFKYFVTNSSSFPLLVSYKCRHIL